MKGVTPNNWALQYRNNNYPAGQKSCPDHQQGGGMPGWYNSQLAGGNLLAQQVLQRISPYLQQYFAQQAQAGQSGQTGSSGNVHNSSGYGEGDDTAPRRGERLTRSSGFGGVERGERSEKGERGEGSERGERSEKGERGEGSERGERSEKGERGEGSERGERSEKGERGEGSER
ncbi:MAG: hypothetical protein MRY59_04235, partial [Aquisalinus sp.]|nr:hypothetical protein [Aquisalinus sp.]